MIRVKVNCQACGMRLAADAYVCPRCGWVPRLPWATPAGYQNPGQGGQVAQVAGQDSQGGGQGGQVAQVAGPGGQGAGQGDQSASPGGQVAGQVAQVAGQAGEVIRPATRQHHPLRRLATWLTIMLAGFIITTLGGSAIGFAVLAGAVGPHADQYDPLFLIGFLLLLSTIPVFLVWLYHASRNAEETGYPLRRSAGWAIGGWFVPVIFLWFPCQCVSDVWRAAQPPERRLRIPWLVVAWWTCWLLAWLTSFTFTHRGQYIHISYGLYFSSISRLVLTVGGFLLIMIVRKVSRSPLGDPSVPAVPGYPVAGPGPAWPAVPGYPVAGPGPAWPAVPGYPVADPGPAWAAPPVISDPHQDVVDPAGGLAGAPPPGPPTPGSSPPGPPPPADHETVPAAARPLSGSKRSWPHLRSRRAKALAGLSVGIVVAALIAVVAAVLAAPASAPAGGSSARTRAPGPRASTQAPAGPATAPPVSLSKDDRWLNGLDSLQTRMNNAMGGGSGSTITPDSLRSQASQFRRCTPELAGLGHPSAQLMSVYQEARRGCIDFGQGAKCYAAAASAFTESGPGLGKFSRLLDCGDAGVNNGSSLLGSAVADGSMVQSP
jgi:hypothetical protein